MNNFLLEVFSEEIPSSDQVAGRQFLEEYFSDYLETSRLPFSEINTFSSPRRLVVVIKDISKFAKCDQVNLKSNENQKTDICGVQYIASYGSKVGDT